jgi:hypothetical protein
MDFNNIFAPDEALPEAVADVKHWLEELEQRGFTVTDLNKRIQILQAVSTKLSNSAKIETQNLDVQKIYESAFPFRPGSFGA